MPKPADLLGDGGLVPPASLVPAAAPAAVAAQARRGRTPYATLAFAGLVIAVIAVLAVAVAVKAIMATSPAAKRLLRTASHVEHCHHK